VIYNAIETGKGSVHQLFLHRDGKEGGPKRTGMDVGVEACYGESGERSRLQARYWPESCVKFPTIKCKTFTDNCVAFYFVHPALQLQSD
jgi:hypothetical protein